MALPTDRCSTTAPHCFGTALQRNGEKKLRSLLTRTPEWGSSNARQAAAAAFGARHAKLAQVLETRHASDLNKEMLIMLCHFWGLRCDLWRLRGNRPTPALRTHGIPTPQPSTPAQSPAAAPSSSGMDAVLTYVNTHARPRSYQAGRLFSGLAARALAFKESAAAEMYVRQLPAVQGVVNCMEMKQRIDHLMSLNQSLHEFDQGVEPGVSNAPAASWMSPPMVDAVPVVLQSGSSLYKAMHSKFDARLSLPGNSEAEKQWLEEVLKGASLVVAQTDDLARLLARSRANDDVATYVRTCCHVLEVVLLNMLSVRSGMKQRLVWLSQLTTHMQERQGSAGAHQLVSRPPLLAFNTAPGQDCPGDGAEDHVAQALQSASLQVAPVHVGSSNALAAVSAKDSPRGSAISCP